MTGKRNFLSYDNSVRERLNRICTEAEAMKEILASNEFNLASADINLSRALLGKEIYKREYYTVILRPERDNFGKCKDYLIDNFSSDENFIMTFGADAKNKSARILAGGAGDKLVEFISETVKKGVSSISEFYNNTNDRYFQVVINPQPQDKIELMLIDQTSLQKHYQQVKRYENLFSKAEETASTGFFQYDTQTHEIHITEAVMNIFECAFSAQPTEKTSLNEYLKCVHVNDKEMVLGKISDEELSSSLDYKHRIVVHNKVKYIHVRGSVFYDSVDDSISIIGTVEDITAFQEVEDRLHRVQHILEETEKIVHIAEWNYQFRDDSFRGSSETAAIMGVNTDDFPLSFGDFIKMIHPDDRMSIYDKFQKSLSAQTDMIDDFRFIDKMGKEKILHFICWNKYDNTGKPLLSRGYIQDISKTYLQEKELKENRKELHSLREMQKGLQTDFQKTLSEKINEIRSKDKYLLQNYHWKAVSDLIKKIAEHWMQPVMYIASQIQNCQETMEAGEFSNEKWLERLKNIKTAIAQMQETLSIFQDSLLQTHHMENLSLHSILEEIMHLFIVKDKYNHINFELTGKKDISFYGSKAEFSEAVINIINNALQVFHQRKISSPELTIKLSTSENDINIDISDNAGGISDEIMDLIFDPYFTTKTTESYSGLGLYISKKIIQESFSGQLRAFNVNSGACFRIILPLNPDLH